MRVGHGSAGLRPFPSKLRQEQPRKPLLVATGSPASCVLGNPEGPRTGGSPRLNLPPPSDSEDSWGAHTVQSRVADESIRDYLTKLVLQQVTQAPPGGRWPFGSGTLAVILPSGDFS